jgi:hypothetical protein
MRTRSKLILAALTTTLLMGLAVGSASAGRLSISNRNIRLTFSPFHIISRESGALFSCNLTLEGSFHSGTIRKVQGALAGYITRASARECSTTILQGTLPWHITYDSFSGTLPRLESLNLVFHRFAFIIDTIVHPPCLFAEDGVRRVRERLNVEPNGLVLNTSVDNTIELPLFEGTEGCFRNVGFEGTGTVRLLGSSTQNISVRLI